MNYVQITSSGMFLVLYFIISLATFCGQTYFWKLIFFSLLVFIYFRHLDLFHEGGEDDFDAMLAEMEKEISMADVMSELGYGCTVSVSQCKEMLSLFLPLTDATTAKILGTIARTNAGLDDSQNAFATFRSALGSCGVVEVPSLNSWNVNVLVDSIKQLVSSMIYLLALFATFSMYSFIVLLLH